MAPRTITKRERSDSGFGPRMVAPQAVGGYETRVE